MKIIATHDRRFHTDEVFAVAILKLIYPDIKIIRTRKPEEFEKCDFIVDVGRNYYSEKGCFDHHQKEFTETRDNKIPYASAGLVWKHFGMKLVNSQKAFDYIDERLIQPIDAVDCGVNIYENMKIHSYGINQVIDSFKSAWYEEDQDKDKAFEKAVVFASNLLSREIKFANGIEKAEDLIKEAIEKSNNKNYVILEQSIPWEKYVIENTSLFYVIVKNSDSYSVYTVRKNLNTFENRKSLPKKWAGLQYEELVKATGIKDAISCHKNRFTIVTESKESAIKLVEMALEKKE